jgi:hypothetical protein
MDIKILHIDSNNAILMRQLQELGFENQDYFFERKKSRQKYNHTRNSNSKPFQNW